MLHAWPTGHGIAATTLLSTRMVFDDSNVGCGRELAEMSGQDKSIPLHDPEGHGRSAVKAPKQICFRKFGLVKLPLTCNHSQARLIFRLQP